MLRYRLLFGAIIALVLPALFVLDGYLADRHGLAWAPCFFIVVLLACIGGAHEMVLLLKRRQWRTHEGLVLGTIAALVLAGAWQEARGFYPLLQAGPLAVTPLVAIILAFLMALLIIESLRTWGPGGIPEALPSLGGSVLTVLYIGLLMQFVVAIRFISEPAGLWCLLTFLAVAKACDMGAYFTGRAVGRHKLIPRLSPNKTVEGLFGGLATSVGVSLAMGLNLLGWTVGQAVVFGLVVGLFAVLGDLAESLIKRSTEAKDSGRTFPGFGGVLDIIDSVLLSAPAAYGLMVLFGARHAV